MNHKVDSLDEVQPLGRHLILLFKAFETELLSSLHRDVKRRAWSIVLQSAPPADDGSLSVLLQYERYVNVEAHIAPKNFANNKAMAEWSLRSVGAWSCGPDDWQ